MPQNFNRFFLVLEHSGEASEVGTNLGTIAIVQASDEVPLNNFAFELSLALNSIGTFIVIDNCERHL